MLQWMGGSRRKLTASRKSTHNRQKQYFEQRKRQQQAPAQEGCPDANSKRANCREGSRSLDVLSLINTAAVVQQGSCSHKCEFGVSQVDSCHSHMLKPSPTVMLKQVITKKFSDYEEACSQSSMLSTEKCITCSQDLSAAQCLNGSVDGWKVALPAGKVVCNNSGILHDEETQNELSVLDLLSDDGPRSDAGGSVTENHVAFSVEGLGKVWVETPAQTPRRLSSPPKATRHSHTTARFKSNKYGLGSKLQSIMSDARMLQEGKPSKIVCRSRGMVDDSIKKESMKLRESYVPDDVYDDQFDSFIGEEGAIYPCKVGRKEQRNVCLPDRFDILEDSFPKDKSCNAPWKSKPICSNSYPSISLISKRTEEDFVGPYSNNTRTSGLMSNRCDISEKAPSTHSFRHSTSEEWDFFSYDWARSSPIGESSNFGKMIDVQAWSLSAIEDTQDSMTLLSEESCSSAAEGEERSHGIGTSSVKPEPSKFNHRDGFHTSSAKNSDLKAFLVDETICHELGEKYQDMIRDSRSLHNQWTADHCSDKFSAFTDITEPDCISLFTKGCTSVNETFAPDFSHRTLKGTNMTHLSRSLMSEDYLFDQLTVPNFYPSVDLGHGSSKAYIPDGSEPSKIISEKEKLGQASASVFQMQKPAARSLDSEVQLISSPFAGDFLRDIESADLPSLGNIRKDDGAFGCFELPQNIFSTGSKYFSSVVDGNLSGEDNKDSWAEHEDSAVDPEAQLNGQEAPEKAEDSSTMKKELSRELEDCIDDKLDHLDGDSIVPLQVATKDYRKEKLEAERKDSGRKGGCSTETSYNMMLGSYVLQLLCVQQVLLDASGKDIVKKGNG